VAKVFVTAPFAIHNPSARKRAMMLDALRRAHLAFDKATKAFVPRAEEFRGVPHGKIRNQIAKFLTPLPISNGAKSGVASDLAGGILSYLELQEGAQKNAGEPTASRMRDSPQDFAKALQNLAAAETDKEWETANIELVREDRAGRLRPMTFIKTRPADGFMLLYAPESEENGKKGRYCVYFNLHSENSRYGCRASKSKIEDPRYKRKIVNIKDMVDVRSGKAVNFISGTGAIFPLSFSEDYQMARFIKKVEGGEFSPQSAKLICRNPQERGRERFEALITFQVTAQAFRPENYIGIDRGINNLVSLCAIDACGAILHRANVDGASLREVQRAEEKKQKESQRRGRGYASKRRLGIAKIAAHHAANDIVAAACEYRALVVMEKLKGFAPRAIVKPRTWRGRNLRRMLPRRQFARIAAILQYKLPLASAPPPVEISPQWTSKTCPECGHFETANRPKPGDDFLCQQCGFGDDGDLNAARVIALKKMWRYNLPRGAREQPFDALLQTENSFAAFLRKLRKKRDGRG
jgi:predicted RNA-binding Zn-ribbon protein involved in translation (DUF1610 family)